MLRAQRHAPFRTGFVRSDAACRHLATVADRRLHPAAASQRRSAGFAEERRGAAVASERARPLQHWARVLTTSKVISVHGGIALLGGLCSRTLGRGRA